MGKRVLCACVPDVGPSTFWDAHTHTDGKKKEKANPIKKHVSIRRTTAKGMGTGGGFLVGSFFFSSFLFFLFLLRRRICNQHFGTKPKLVRVGGWGADAEDVAKQSILSGWRWGLGLGVGVRKGCLSRGTLVACERKAARIHAIACRQQQGWGGRGRRSVVAQQTAAISWCLCDKKGIQKKDEAIQLRGLEHSLDGWVRRIAQTHWRTPSKGKHRGGR